MQAIVFTCLLLFCTLAGLRAQDEGEALHDDENVRVMKFTMNPDQAIPMREFSANRVLICLDDGEGKQTLADGTVHQASCKAGFAAWAPAGQAYSSQSTSRTPFRIIEIELKGKEQPPVSITDFDPVIADPKHYQVALENDHVRVIRVRYGPMETGAIHEHVRNFVVVYLTKQARGDSGEVRFHIGEGTIRHTENNPLDEPVERLAIELK